MTTHLPLVDEPDHCTPCGARCCKTFPGIPHPEDLAADAAALRIKVRDLLATGLWTVAHDSCSRLDYEPGDWYLRPSIKGYEQNRVTSIFEHGQCVFLTAENRCGIYDERPRGCRTLVAQAGFRCVDPTTKIEQVAAWKKHEAMLLEEGWSAS